MAGKAKTRFFCQECGHESPRWMGRCPGCGSWNSMVEERVVEKPQGKGFSLGAAQRTPPQPIREIKSESYIRIPTGIGELDRVLGGGMVTGSYILLAGVPGIGKSTLAMQAADKLATHDTVLYVSGEESADQLKLRAERLEALSPHLYVVSDTDITEIERYAVELKPILLIVDSVQTLYDPEIASAPGSVSQVRECAGRLFRLSKQHQITTLILGHVNKDDSIAGPRVVEHMVDVVLMFEGDVTERGSQLRILRSQKNRFGKTDVGLFEHYEKGLREVVDPSAFLLDERPDGASGSVVVPTMEGSRPLLVEVQALVSNTSFNYPRRTAEGIEMNRLTLLLAVLEKRVGLQLIGTHDVYARIAGGLSVREPAADLAIATAVASSFRDIAVDPKLVVIGEVGMAGEVRSVARLEERLQEAERRGFARAIIPAGSMRTAPQTGLRLIPVRTVLEALQAALSR